MVRPAQTLDAMLMLFQAGEISRAEGGKAVSRGAIHIIRGLGLVGLYKVGPSYSPICRTDESSGCLCLHLAVSAALLELCRADHVGQ